MRAHDLPSPQRWHIPTGTGIPILAVRHLFHRFRHLQQVLLVGSLLTLGTSLPLLSAHAQTLARMQIRKAATLSGDLLYWFVGPNLSPSPPKPLPPPEPGGAITLLVPADYNRPDTEVRIVKFPEGKVAHLPLKLATNRPAPIPPPDPVKMPGANLLRNGDFSNAIAKWTLEVRQGAATADLANIPPPPGVTGKVLRIPVTQVGTMDWHIQINQAGLDLAENTPYIVTFWAKADSARNLHVKTQIDNGDYHFIGLITQVPLTTAWQKFSLPFTAKQTLKNHGRLSFEMGDAVGTVDLAGVELLPAMSDPSTPSQPAGPNLVQNGDFARTTDHWKLELNMGMATTSFPVEAPPQGVSGKVMEVNVTELGTQNWHIQLVQPAFDLTEGSHYTISFWAKADHARPIIAIIVANLGDYHPVGLNSSLNLTPEWHKFTIPFTAQNTVKNNSRLTFVLGEALGTVDLAGVELHSGAETSAPPASPTSDALPMLTVDDFKYAQVLEVPVKYKGKRVYGVVVTLKFQNKAQEPYHLVQADYGIARFNDVPFGVPLSITVSQGAATARFDRTLAASPPYEISAIDLPESWKGVKTTQ